MSGVITAAVVVAGGAAYAASESSKAAGQATAAQSEAAAAAQNTTAAQLEFSKEQYADWKSVYGDIQTNLGNYYKSLTPSRLAAQNLQGIQTEYQNSMKNLEQNLAQRGIATSGIMGEGLTQLEVSRAQQSAEARFLAPQQAAQQQAAFLGLGLGQAAPLQAGIAGASAQQSSLQMQQAGMYGQQAQIAGQGTGNAIAALGNVAGQFISNYGSVNTTQPTQYQLPSLPYGGNYTIS